MEKIKEYTNGEITVIWKPDTYIHSGNCVRGLNQVFNPRNKPWIKIHSETSDEIIKTVNNCPSGALTFKRNDDMQEKTQTFQPMTKVQVIAGGPLKLEGSLIIVDKDSSETIKEGKVFLCRCGGSKNKPYCDGTHKTVEFDK